MIHITLTGEKPSPANDPLGRDAVRLLTRDDCPGDL